MFSRTHGQRWSGVTELAVNEGNLGGQCGGSYMFTYLERFLKFLQFTTSVAYTELVTSMQIIVIVSKFSENHRIRQHKVYGLTQRIENFLDTTNRVTKSTYAENNLIPVAIKSASTILKAQHTFCSYLEYIRLKEKSNSTNIRTDNYLNENKERKESKYEDIDRMKCE